MFSTMFSTMFGTVFGTVFGTYIRLFNLFHFICFTLFFYILFEFCLKSYSIHISIKIEDVWS